MTRISRGGAPAGKRFRYRLSKNSQSVIRRMARGDNASVSLILVFAWSAFSANCLSWRELAILLPRAIR
jgi:hypothetical protein